MIINPPIPFDEYCDRPEMNGSTLWQGAPPDGNMSKLKFSIDGGCVVPDDVVRVGSTLHWIVEFLPVNKFEESFVVMPDFHLSKLNETLDGGPSESKNTVYVKDEQRHFKASNTDREVLDENEYRRIIRMLQAISENKEAMELIISADREITVTGEIDNLPCKGRIDGLAISHQWNLKTTGRITERAFTSHALELGYPFKDALHRELLRQSGMMTHNGFSYIVVLDSKPNKLGVFREPADCIVVPVPEVVLDNQLPLIRRTIRQYQECLKCDVWPGMQPYTFTVPTWAMTEHQFEDTLEYEGEPI